MIIHYKDAPTSYKITFHKILKYTDDFSFIPLKITNFQGHGQGQGQGQGHGQDIHKKPDKCVFQTPLLFAPYGIQHRGTKQTLDLSFMNRPNDSYVDVFYNHCQHIFEIVSKKFSKRYKVNPFLKDTPFSECMRVKVGSNLLIFDQVRQTIDTISSFSYGTFLLDLHGLWVSEKPQREIWFQWYLVQAKIIEPICMQEYVFMDDYDKPPQASSDTKEPDKYDKMLKMGVPKEAVDRQRKMDGYPNHLVSGSVTGSVSGSRIPPPPPPPPLKHHSLSPQQSPQPMGRPMIQAHDLQNVKLSSSKRRVNTKEPIQTKDKDMGYFEPPSLGDIQSMLKKLKPLQ